MLQCCICDETSDIVPMIPYPNTIVFEDKEIEIKEENKFICIECLEKHIYKKIDE